MSNTELLLHLVSARQALDNLWFQYHETLITYALCCFCFAAGTYEGWLLKGNRSYVKSVLP